jgi:hypothetical protein
LPGSRRLPGPRPRRARVARGGVRGPLRRALPGAASQRGDVSRAREDARYPSLPRPAPASEAPGARGRGASRRPAGSRAGGRGRRAGGRGGAAPGVAEGPRRARRQAAAGAGAALRGGAHPLGDREAHVLRRTAPLRAGRRALLRARCRVGGGHRTDRSAARPGASCARLAEQPGAARGARRAAREGAGARDPPGGRRPGPRPRGAARVRAERLGLRHDGRRATRALGAHGVGDRLRPWGPLRQRPAVRLPARASGRERAARDRDPAAGRLRLGPARAARPEFLAGLLPALEAPLPPVERAQAIERARAAACWVEALGG